MDDETLRLIGIDPSTTSTFSDSPTNKQIETQYLGGSTNGLKDLVNWGKSLLTGDASSTDYSKAAALLGGLYSANQSSAPTIYNPGYSGGIPEMFASRNMVTAPPAGRRPGSGGIDYGGNVVYEATGKKLGFPDAGVVNKLAPPVTYATLKPTDPPERVMRAYDYFVNEVGGNTPEARQYAVDFLKKQGFSDAQIGETYLEFMRRYKGPSSLSSAEMVEQLQPVASDLTSAYNTVRGAGYTVKPSEIFGALATTDVKPTYEATLRKGSDPAVVATMYDQFVKEVGIGNTPEVQKYAADYLKKKGFSDEEISVAMQTYKSGKFAEGGLAADGFVIPADVVSHLGNGSSEAGLEFLAETLGAKPIKGDGDGMSDSIPTSIDGTQPARVANEEAFVSPEVVKRLGDGDTDRGAKKLYAMMDRIRKARTGTTEQGKQINPEKFMPGGKVDRYQTGGTTTTSGGSSLSEWAGPYVADMLGKGKALSEMPYQAYTGPLTAGASPLQEQAFGAAQQYQVPTGIAQAGQTAGGIADAFMKTSYDPATFTSTFAAPKAYEAGTFQNQFTAPTQTYTPGTFQTETFGTQQAQQYMNPFIESALNPQLREAKRQAEAARQADAARMASAGAFGGGRQAIMESEARRNLLGRLSDITGTGYATAYDKAQQAFTQDQARLLQAQQAAEQAKQFGTAEARNIAELQARYGLSADQAREQSRQFGAQQGMTAAQLAAQYGLEAQKATESSRQFGAGLSMEGLRGALQAAEAQGRLGTAEAAAGLDQIRSLADLGAVQRGIEAEGIAADRTQFEEARVNPYKMLQFQQSLLQGLPLAAQTVVQPGQSNLQQFAVGATTVQQALKSLGLL